MRAEIIETIEGNRVAVTELKLPIGDQTHCLELHRTTGDPCKQSVFFILLTRAELGELSRALGAMVG